MVRGDSRCSGIARRWRSASFSFAGQRSIHPARLTQGRVLRPHGARPPSLSRTTTWQGRYPVQSEKAAQSLTMGRCRPASRPLDRSRLSTLASSGCSTTRKRHGDRIKTPGQLPDPPARGCTPAPSASPSTAGPNDRGVAVTEPAAAHASNEWRPDSAQRFKAFAHDA